MAEQERRSKATVDGNFMGKLDDKAPEKVYVDVHFVCQQCSQPLKLHESLTPVYFEEKLEEMKRRDEEFQKEGKMPSNQTEQDENKIERRREWAMNTQRSIEGLDQDATLLDLMSREDVGGYHNTRVRLQLAEQYFNALSSTSPVDHPLCEDCLKSTQRRLENDILFSEEARIGYDDLLKKWQQEYDSEEGKTLEKELEEEVEQLKLEEEQLKKELEDIEAKRNTVKGELKDTIAKLELLKEEDRDLHRQYNIHQGEMLQLQDEVRGIEYQTAHATSQLKLLKKTNVLSMAFHIWHQGLFGTINGFRLGRLTTVPVEWSEINAAWGQCALLLTCLARYANVTFQKFSVVAYGNQSYVLQYPEKDGRNAVSLPLYTSGGYKFMMDSKFDRAMVAYLDCFSQLKKHIESTGKGYKLPYGIEKDKIGEDGKVYSIKMQGNSPEHWTKALKFLLTNLQWSIGWHQLTTVR